MLVLYALIGYLVVVSLTSFVGLKTATPKMQDAADVINSKFRYVTDWQKHRKKDVWTVLRGNVWRGDCEDYALGVIWLLANKSWLGMLWLVISHQAILWQSNAPNGERHMCLWYRGRWIDNIVPEWKSKTIHKKRFPIAGFFLLLKLTVK